MFSPTNHDTEVIGFRSISHTPLKVSHNDCQTPTRTTNESSVQVKHCLSTETQTDLTTSDGEAIYDTGRLATFLHDVLPLVLEELETTIDFADDESTHIDDESSALLRLGAMDQLAGAGKVSCLSWSSTGGTLAAATSVFRHDSWCNHDSQIGIFTTSVQQQQPFMISTAACVTSLQFHPWEPSVLVAGLYNGEVVIRDLRREDDWAARESQVEHDSHVVFVGWCGTVDKALCVSAAADGRILLRKFGHQSRSLTVVHRFLITNSHISNKYQDRDETVEITYVLLMDNDTCVVGVAGGGLYLARLSPLTNMVSHPGYHDPVIMVYQRHRSLISSIAKGHGPGLFAAASYDGEIKVYSVKEVEPKYVIHMKGCPLHIFWTEAPTILGVCGIKNEIKFVRITTGQNIQLCLELSGKHRAVTAKVNEKRNVVAVGDSEGNIELWRITVSKN